MLTIDDRDGVRVIRMAHGKVNAMDIALCEALSHEMAAARRDGSVRAVVIAGTGSSFSAGVDLFKVVNGGAAYVERFLPVLDAMLRDVLTCPRPVVAAVNGHAIAGGCILMCACDYRVMAEGNGRVALTELTVGVPFPALALEIVAARVSPSVLRGLVYSGRAVQVDEAIAMGLVEEKCPSDVLLDRACAVARRMGAIPATAFALTKASFYQPALERVRHPAEIDARVAEEWRRPATYDTIRAYLEKTVGKK